MNWKRMTSIRTDLELSQVQFSKRFGLSYSMLKAWEQGVREPSRPVRVLYRVIEKHPELVAEALKEDRG